MCSRSLGVNKRQELNRSVLWCTRLIYVIPCFTLILVSLFYCEDPLLQCEDSSYVAVVSAQQSVISMMASLTDATAMEAERVLVGSNPEAGHHDVATPSSYLFDTDNVPVSVFETLELPAFHDIHGKLEPTTSTIQLAHAATGRMKEVTIVPGTVRQLDRVSQNNVEVYPISELTGLIRSQILDLPDIAPEVFEERQSRNPRFCEVVLRYVFAPRGPGEALEECMQTAEVVKKVFTIQPSVYSKAESRALKVAQYRRAELQLKLETLMKDKVALVPPTQFSDPVVYQSWKMKELQILSNLVDLFGNLPTFSGGVQVKILSGEGLKLETFPKCAASMLKKKVVERHVYCSVTILPSRLGTMPSPVETEDDTVERTPAYFSEVVSCVEDAEWNSQSPWIPICSLQERILIEVWEKSDLVVRSEEFASRPKPQPQPEVVIENSKLTNIRGIFKRQSTSRRKKVAPWSGDIFLGQVIISFNHIESQGLAHGGVQGQTPATSYVLADERGKQEMSTLQLQFTCSCERFYRDAPSNKLLLMSPVEDIETAYDNLVRLSFHAENEALMKPVVKAIEQFQSLFPGSRSKEVISKLIEPLGLVLRWDPDPVKIFIPLKSFIQDSCERRVYQHFFINKDGRKLEELTAESMLEAVKLVRSDLAEQVTTYTKAFPNGFSLPQVTAPVYYRLVCHYISSYMKESSPWTLFKQHEELLNEFILLRGDVEKLGLKAQDFGIEDLFTNHLEHWIGSLASRMTHLVDSAVCRESWEPLSTQPLISISVIDLYTMVGQVVDDVAVRLTSFLVKNENMYMMVDALCKCIHAYVDAVEKHCLQGLLIDVSKDHGNGPHVSNSLGWPRAVSIQMNNVSAVLEEQRKLKSVLMTKWQSSSLNPEFLNGFSKLENLVQQTLTELITAALESTQGKFKYFLLKEDVAECDEETYPIEPQLPLVKALDHEVKVLRLSLYPELMEQFLRYPKLGKVNDALHKHFRAVQLRTPLSSKEGSTRLHKILACRSMEPQKLRDVFSEAWKTYQRRSEPGRIISPRNNTEAQRTNNVYRLLSQTKSPSKSPAKSPAKSRKAANGFIMAGPRADTQLHVLDYLSILKSYSDRKSRDLVLSHSSTANSKYMQIELKLGREKTLATSSCRLSGIIPGLFYVTPKRVCFVKYPGVPSERWCSSFLTFDNIRQIVVVGSDILLFVPLNGHRIKVSRILDRDAALAVIHQQISGTGIDVEKHLALISSQSSTGSDINQS